MVQEAPSLWQLQNKSFLNLVFRTLLLLLMRIPEGVANLLKVLKDHSLTVVLRDDKNTILFKFGFQEHKSKKFKSILFWRSFQRPSRLLCFLPSLHLSGNTDRLSFGLISTQPPSHLHLLAPKKCVFVFQRKHTNFWLPTRNQKF